LSSEGPPPPRAVNDAQGRRKREHATREVNPEGLLCALILAPRTFPRNRFFGLFEEPKLRRVRRRARHVRGILRQLTAVGKDRALITGRLELEDERLLLRYRIESLSLERTTALSGLEAATMAYALHRAGMGELTDEDRARVETALATLGPELVLDVGTS
jgi:hypothetical protein